ncbi:Mu transposase C-terminal domain-containing protein [Caballeronia mineralivorans]|uniref:Mu transposase C-terminal domain-containing protein n=1 Tax=Caballeronia mineralivorans TaxID=2010198 RepID=UPI0023F3C7A1|nr:Mu transposase C-terminal domain-containing protein [Caballeronia mineralivorans]MEA3100153.1 putative transposase [Caballeronia mineralivorans]
MTSALTLKEFERWFAIEVARRYHESLHRGLLGATPADTWCLLCEGPEAWRLPPTADAELRFLIRFLPVAQRTIQSDGLTLFHIRYWHPIFVAWREARRTVGSVPSRRPFPNFCELWRARLSRGSIRRLAATSDRLI